MNDQYKIERFDSFSLLEKRGLNWDIDVEGVKVFFDIRESKQTLIGKMILFGARINHLKHWLLGQHRAVIRSVVHVGFVLRDGRLIHASKDKGVLIEEDDSEYSIKNSPESYIIFNAGGNEDELLLEFIKLQDEMGDLYGKKESYDIEGIIRVIPLIGRWFKRKITNDNLKFYCSGLVATLLIKCNIINIEDLRTSYMRESEHSKEELLRYIDITPTTICELLFDKGMGLLELI